MNKMKKITIKKVATDSTRVMMSADIYKAAARDLDVKSDLRDAYGAFRSLSQEVIKSEVSDKHNDGLFYAAAAVAISDNLRKRTQGMIAFDILRNDLINGVVDRETNVRNILENEEMGLANNANPLESANNMYYKALEMLAVMDAIR